MQTEKNFLGNLVDAVQVLIVTLDAEGRIMLFNRACQEATGYSDGEVLGRNWFDLFLPERVKEEAGEIFQKLLDGQRPSHYESPILTKDGQERLIKWDHTLLCDEEGTVRHVMTGTDRDITEHQQAEEGLLESGEELKVILDDVRDGIALLNMTGKVIKINKRLVEVGGYTEEEVVGKRFTLLKMFTPQSIAKMLSTFVKIISGQKPPPYEVEVYTKIGEKLNIEIHSSLLRKEGKAVGVVAVMRDITERKRTEEVLKRRLEQLTSLSQASQAVTVSLELDQVLAKIVSLASQVVASDYASVVLVDEEGRLGRSAEYLPGVPAIDRRIRVEGFTNWIVRSRQAVVVDEIDEDGTVNPRPANGAQSPEPASSRACDVLSLSKGRGVEGPCTANPLVVKAGVKSFVGLPLVVKDRLLGVLYLHSLRPSHFRDQLPLLITFANQAAVAIENARLYQAERKRAAQLAVVSQVARQAASILDLDQLLQEVVAAIQQSFNYHSVTIDLLDEAAGELEPLAVAGSFVGKIPPGYRQAVGVGMVGWTAETGQSLLANDVSQEPRYIPGFLEEPLAKSELCVPLKLAGQVIGVLDIEDARLNAFDETDLLAMETLADQIAMAIENARLFRETKRRFEETMALYQTSLDITAQLEMTKLLKSIVERAAILLQAESGGIYLYDPEREELGLAISYGYTEKYVGVTLKPGEGMAGKVLQTGEPLIVDDYRTWEGRASVYETDQAFTAVLEVPLKWQERIIGVLSLSADVQKRAFNQDDVWLATLFANQAAVAIENARIYEEERKRVTQLELIGGITQKTASILDLDELLSQVARMIRDTFGYYHTNIFLVETNSDELIMKASAGPLGETLVNRLRLKIGREGITGWVAHSGKPLLVNDVSLEPRYYSADESEDTRSELAVPIKLKGEIIGVLDVESVELGDFNQDDIFILQTLADQLAVAIENARLYQETQQRADEMAILYDTALDIAAKLDTRQLLQTIVERATELLNGMGGAMYLYRPEQDELELALTYKLKKDFTGTVLRRGEGLSGKVLESGEPMMVDCYREWSGRSPLYEGAPFEATIAVPVKWRDQILGIINVLRQREAETFDDQDVRLLTLFANQAAVAIENARLHEETRRRAERLAVLNHIARALSTTLNLDELLEVIYREVTAVMEADAFFIALYDRAANELDYRIRIDRGGVREPPERQPLGLGLASIIVMEKKPVLIRDFEKEKDRYPQVGVWGTMEVPASGLDVPILLGDQVVGVISVQAYRPEAYGQEEQLLLTTIADQVAVAIENARLYEQVAGSAAELEAHVQERTAELIRRARELSFLYQASVALSSSLESDQVLDILTQQAALAVDAVDCTICELQDDVLVAVASYRDPALPWKDPEIGRRYLLADYPATREAIEKGQPLRVRVDDPLADEAERADLQEWGYAALLQVHIISRGQVVGVVEVFDNKPEREFSEGDAALLQTIANQAGMAIEKARLFQQVREERNHLELLYEVSRKLSASLDLKQALHDIFQVSIAATGASRGSAFVFDDEGRVSHRILTRDLSPAEADGTPDRVLRKGLAGWVFEHKRPTIVFDTSHDERWLPFPDDTEPAGSAMAVPFIERDRVRGLLTLVHPQPYHFNRAHLELFSSVAHQVAVVIERARLYEETRRRAQEVAQQKEQTDAIVQSMADGLIVTDLENKLVLANPAAEELLKFRLEDSTGQDIGANIRDDRLRQIVRDTLDKQQAGYEVDIELTDPYDGVQRVMRAHTAVVNDPSGRPMGIVTSLRDVTHERELQHLKDELVSTVSHELRTPMTSVLGFSELLLTRQLSEEKRHLYTQTIHKEAQRLSALINDFLDIQRMGRGQQEYHLEEVDLGELAREAVATYSGQSDAHTLTMDLPPDLPLVQADPDRLRQVFGNLLSNAIKFSPGGGVVAVSVQADGDEIHVTVSDEGIGIPAEAMAHLFERFFRVDSSDRRAIQGTGLGLAICKEIVEAHDGHIWAESREGVGTTVTFSLPMMIKKRILVIDDEKDIRGMFQRLLSEESCEVLTAANGQEGLSLMQEELPDLVMLDIAMPVMNGYQFLERVKEDRRMKDIPVVVISGVDTDIDRLKELGADEFLSKPFSNTVLLDTMWRLLKRS